MTLPNRVYLADIERFLRLIKQDGSADLSFELRDGLFSVHLLVLCMIAAMGERAVSQGGSVVLMNEVINPSTRYLERMGLFRQLGVETSITVSEHEPAGRFIPLRQIADNNALNDFIVDFVPLLHASPDEAASVKYVLFELVRNVLEHSRAEGGAYVAAQVARKSGRLLLGVADAGVGVKESISFSHPVATDQDAIALAFRPGITGVTPHFGGNETNGGAGLFFMKAMATMARHHMVMISGSTLMKLLTQPASTVEIHSRLEEDRVRWVTTDPPYLGTAVGIDITVDATVGFSKLLKEIRKVYAVRIKESKKAKYRARFV